MNPARAAQHLVDNRSTTHDTHVAGALAEALGCRPPSSHELDADVVRKGLEGRLRSDHDKFKLDSTADGANTGCCGQEPITTCRRPQSLRREGGHAPSPAYARTLSPELVAPRA